MRKILYCKHPRACTHSWAVFQGSLMLLHVMSATYNWWFFFFLLWIIKLRNPYWSWWFQVFLVRKIRGLDRGQLYAMKVLKKATLKGTRLMLKHELLDSESLFQLSHLHFVCLSRKFLNIKKNQKNKQKKSTQDSFTVVGQPIFAHPHEWEDVHDCQSCHGCLLSGGDLM